jgi:hypothetical protein
MLYLILLYRVKYNTRHTIDGPTILAQYRSILPQNGAVVSGNRNYTLCGRCGAKYKYRQLEMCMDVTALRGSLTSFAGLVS